MLTDSSSLALIAALVSLTLAQGASAQDKIDLESTFVGDKEQPSVSYFIPWKPPAGPDQLYRSITSVAGKVFEVVDRDIHSRTMQFYDELSLEAPAGSAE
ncbi:hypothetical protein FDP08_09705 [Marinobacter panjinensis]|uniref:Uncharacterized protein n=1 Tax=Marinobacter panjinensis TaxID=2576384 RepID=A0A4V6CXQ1_9GAMM|nr:hypothetical protein [Marinobacter panjinensis]MCR8916184.1 hypothetical protein [Marinobacter panjinensis]TKV68345.1 hypothetical protein FDP08_09705 [Marinobacter panjinensis]